jgi:hypothetical protein
MWRRGKPPIAAYNHGFADESSTAMEAEFLNALEAKLADLKARSEDLRRYL